MARVIGIADHGFEQKGGSVKKLIQGGRLLDIAGHAAPPADILIDGDIITDIGPPGMAAPAAEIIDATGNLIIPGLVNAHGHGHGNLGKATGDRWTLELMLNAAPWSTGRRGVEDRRLSAALMAVELVRKGCTATVDLQVEYPAPSRDGLEQIGAAYHEVGLRAVIAPMFADRTLYEAIPGLNDALTGEMRVFADSLRLAPHDVSLAAIEDALKHWPYDRDKVALAIAPTIPHHCSEALLVGARDLARDYDVGFHTHLCESKIQAIACQKIYGMSQTAYLDSLGILGPGFVAAHAIWIDDDDISRLADAGASVAHNAGSNMRLGNGMAAVRRMLDRGVNLGIGTDACTCADNLNMFEAMRMASFVARVQDVDWSRWLSAEEILAMATTGGAKLLGLGDVIGELRPGAKADMVFLDLGNINYVPFNIPTVQVVNAEDGTAVESVMIGGKLVLDHGRITTIDEKKLFADAQRAADRLLGPAADETHAMVLRMAEIVGPFCLDILRQDYHVRRHLE